MMPQTVGRSQPVKIEETTYPQIDRRANLSRKEFNREYRSPGKPVVIADAIEEWRARSAWTFDFFASRYGSDAVQAYKYKGDKYQQKDATQMRLDEYIHGVTTQDWNSFPYYIRDNWALLLSHPELAADYRFPHYFYDWFSLLPPFMRLRYPRIFIGPKGAVTPLHVDIWRTHAWLSQLVGRKRWILFPPEQQPLLYNCKVEVERPDFDRFPLYRDVHPVECTIGPGETVFVPGGWAHWVVSLDATISLSANYMGPGAFWSPLRNATRELVLKRLWTSIRRSAPRAARAASGS
jgi:histone arginine demethylase JMJD6